MERQLEEEEEEEEEEKRNEFNFAVILLCECWCTLIRMRTLQLLWLQAVSWYTGTVICREEEDTSTDDTKYVNQD